MSKEAVIQLLERAIAGPAFAGQLKADFDAAVKGYDLTAHEVAALRNGDEAGMRAMGVDERLSKSYVCFR